MGLCISKAWCSLRSFVGISLQQLASAHDSFHGTAISLVQHPTTSNKGIDRDIPVLNETVESQRKIAQLPEIYTSVQPAFLQVKDPFVPPVVGQLKPSLATPESIEKEYEWLNHLRELFDRETLRKDDYLSWAGFHASRQPPSTHTTAIIALLPMFLENAHSVAMILHSMNVVKSAVQHINPNRYQSLRLISHCLLLRSRLSGTGQHHTERISL
ncbi:hypothetical protein OS493_019348 [Desmophyllum pertusum]|uniref:Uncharacterized protein n=1 Tax=Desmophyllum pertusum TaxID=174260 RepID=A0A9X0A0P1_9CNID|nr:hypothetical protein OS493_019348 [Desmophyllum pertusum]